MSCVELSVFEQEEEHFLVSLLETDACVSHPLFSIIMSCVQQVKNVYEKDVRDEGDDSLGGSLFGGSLLLFSFLT